jgi:outer membrane protein OmpA-like peptidoglycan-associated protein
LQQVGGDAVPQRMQPDLLIQTCVPLQGLDALVDHCSGEPSAALADKKSLSVLAFTDPDLPGFRESEGCPPVEKELRKKIALAAKNIFFETDKYTLLPSSFKSLDEVVVILRQDTWLKLDIAGHTDNSGTPEKNQLLSERRARAVLEYILSKPGISKERLSSAGYGSSRPVTSNETPEGRALNRRVEFVLRY